MYVLVLLGGTSDERAVSLRSGKAVVTALTEKGYSVSEYDPRDGEAGLVAAAQDVDVVFPVLHGAGGEDGALQAILEAHGIPVVGTGSIASKLCFHKWEYKSFLQKHHIATPDGELVNTNTFLRSPLLERPFVLKPVDGGSSIDTFIVRGTDNRNDDAISDALQRHGDMLLEALIRGPEITVAVLDDLPLPVIEIIPPADQEFDYENKYNGATQELCPPKNVSEHIQQNARELAGKIHRLTGCRGMSRTDMIIDDGGKLWVLETNTIPGLTDQSLFPKAAQAAGIDMPVLVDRLVRSAIV